MRVLIATSLIALSLTGCASTPAGPADGFVIFTPAMTGRMLGQCSRQTPPPGQGAWTPKPGQIAALEKTLPAALAAKGAERYVGSPIQLHSWWRQYVGVVRDGRRYIYGNFTPRDAGYFTEGHAQAWKTGPTVMCHGGSAYFGVEIDARTGEITHLAYNVGGPPS